MVDFNDEPAGAVAAPADGHSRRAFLASAAGLTGVALASGAWRAPAAFAAEASSAPAGPDVLGSFGPSFIDLTLDGVPAGHLLSVEGGHATADVVTEKLGADGIVRKHIAGVKYEDITLSCGTGMSKGFYNWIKASFDMTFAPRSGELDVGNAAGETSKLSFANALISEVGLPALDAASKDAAKMTIKFSPETTRYSRTGGGHIKWPSLQKTWLPSNFKLEIDGLDATRVNKIDHIILKLTDATIAGQKLPGRLEIPNLVISLPEARSDSWERWLEDFVIKGNNGQEAERSGKLTYLATDGTTLFTLGLSQLGIFKLTPEKVEAGSENIRRVKAELYCEQMTFTFGG